MAVMVMTMMRMMMSVDKYYHDHFVSFGRFKYLCVFEMIKNVFFDTCVAI